MNNSKRTNNDGGREHVGRLMKLKEKILQFRYYFKTDVFYEYLPLYSVESLNPSNSTVWKEIFEDSQENKNRVVMLFWHPDFNNKVTLGDKLKVGCFTLDFSVFPFQFHMNNSCANYYLINNGTKEECLEEVLEKILEKYQNRLDKQVEGSVKYFETLINMSGGPER